MAGNIVVAWLLTIPCAAIVAALVYVVLHLLGRDNAPFSLCPI